MASSISTTIGLMVPVVALGILLVYLSTDSGSTALELPEHMLKVPEEYQAPQGDEEVVVAPKIEPPKFQFVFPSFTNQIEIKRGESITIPVSMLITVL